MKEFFHNLGFHFWICYRVTKKEVSDGLAGIEGWSASRTRETRYLKCFCGKKKKCVY